MSETPLLPTSDSMRQRRRERFNLQQFQGWIRLVLPASVVAAFLLFIFTTSIVDETRHRLPLKQPDVEFPDFSHYKFLQTLPHTHFPIPSSVPAYREFDSSLSPLQQTARADFSTKLSSDPVLTFMSTNHVLGVRGNNDEKVIEWGAWMEWIVSLPGGREWLEDMDSYWSHIDGDESNAEFDTWLKKSHQRWGAYVPSDWKLQGKYYKIARSMSQEHYDYLRSLPLVLYAPIAHTYFVHAGLLAADPTREYSDPKQPLSHWPTTANPEEDRLVLRGLQELALLNEIPQNQDPWVLMNMRSLSKDGKVKEGKKGTPWAELWNDVMSSCSGLSATEPLTIPSEHGSTTHTPLQCFPSMVIYGHAAARDLDVKRWSVGVDTGCVSDLIMLFKRLDADSYQTYSRRLTAVVLDAKSFLPQTHSATFGASLHESLILYGDEGIAQVTSVKCHA
ncbi:hypothetical protein J3R82DRAFT_11524 [Butyriboletus roseoflavus]|nr:hypothetical protein J3R82DRAFT_11524 [Butyriboletus roseoflavus]